MSGTKFSVSWDAYKKNICNGLSFLQQKEEFVDMTIAADGHVVKVHRMVMSLVSPFIKELITSAQCPHPVLFLNRVSYETLELLLEYAYTGEVLVPQERLSDFLEVCNTLHIRGLENTNQSDIQTTEIEDNTTEANNAASINVSQLSTKYNETSADDNFDTPMDEDDVNTDNGSSLIVDKERQKGLDTLNKSSLQYSLSSHGTLQLILNRYIYSKKYTRKDKSKTWRCSQSKTCQAIVTTRGSQLVERLGAHNHPFHDAQILKRVKRNNVFSVEPKEHEIAAKKVFDNLQDVKKLL